jgi:hypothetical protein
MRDKSDANETPDSQTSETDKRVAAIGKASEALEYIERARGHLYSFHQLMGRGDIEFGVACDLLESAGIADDAARLRREIVGRNALDGRWSFQIVDEFDDLYYEPARYEVRRLEQRHLNGHRHAYEASLKEQRRTVGHPAHTSRPPHSK